MDNDEFFELLKSWEEEDKKEDDTKRASDLSHTMRWNSEAVKRAAPEKTEPRAPRSSARRVQEEKKRRRRWLIFVLVVSFIIAEVAWLLVNDMCSLNKREVTATVEITKDDNVGSIANKLKDAGLIEYRWLFRLFAGARDAKSKIGVGNYELTSDMDYNALINGMRNNNAALDSKTVRVTVPEGYTVRQVIALLDKYGVSNEKDLIEAAKNGTYDYSFLDDSRKGDLTYLEGYLFPDTYDFFVDEEPVHALDRFLANFENKVDDEVLGAVKDSGKSLYDILKVASLIEKETDGGDRRRIASVIYNRLNKSGETAHLLQIDASTIYGLGDRYTGTLSEADMNYDTPYNLSIHTGLPPTPIANPGLDSIWAAIEPEKTDYFFYALGKDEVHHFFKTYNEHLKFVKSNAYGG